MFIYFRCREESVNNRDDAEYFEFKGLLSFLILHELKLARLYGEQLADRIGRRKGEPLTPGTIYPALKRLRQQKLIRFTRDGRKKIYSLTDEGGAELKRLYRLFGRYFAGLREKIPARRTVKRRSRA